MGAGAYADATSATHALLWTGSAASAINLNPATFDYSQAKATDGVQQVGYVGRWSESMRRAALWGGSAQTFVDLTPQGFLDAEAFGVSQGQQVGYGNFFGRSHALLWSGTATSFVDLNPGSPDQWGSIAYATNGARQVGTAGGSLTNFARHAATWSGTANSYQDLHLLLQEAFRGQGEWSEALAVDEHGNIAGYAWDIQRGAYSAILWRPVPEPSSLTSLALLLLAARLVSTGSRRKH